MKHIELLANALTFIENNLTNPIKTEDIATACYCSKSTLEKMFQCSNGISIRDYIIRRRMTLAAKTMMQESAANLLDIALQYGYSSNEAFTRAFKQIWNCTPADFRKQAKFSALYPRLLCPLETGDEYMQNRKHVDISELYDLFSERKDCYFVCCDIKSLIPINEISHKAGDLAILECMNRMNQAAGAEDIVFRIGGDEFVMLTNSTDITYAEKIAESILAQNGQTFDYEGQAIPLNLYAGITKLQSNSLKYDALFAHLHTALKDVKR
ncbi:MAG: helix-turn-helix domain-containing protein [Lachnospiraceae bacterium]|nr:helix-turn-helix domain-containing protein [Lachnospiraceae bacterium]